MALDAIRKQFGSNAKAAARLREQWMRTKPGEARKMTVNSLATKIGDLARQQTDWWARRPVPTRLLADMLGCTELDLLGRPVVPAGSLDFPEFPALPPLRPDELPPHIQRGGWLLDRVRDEVHQGVRVLVAGPGMGKSFVVRWLQAHAASEFAAISTPTLAAGLHLVNDPRILVLDVDEQGPRSDADALRALGQREQPTIVLAPFALAGISLDETMFAFDARARASLLAWVAQRLELSDRDTRFDRDEVDAWLRANDPNVQIVATPADLLAFCADVDACGLDEVTWEIRARRWLRSFAPGLFTKDRPSWVPVIETLGDELCRAMVTRREYPWGALPGAVWATLLPDELRGPDDSRWGRAAMIQGLRDAGLLRGAENGLAFTPSWIRHGLAAGALDRMLAADDIDAWGLLAADESRQHLVDAALERRKNADFRATVRAVARVSDRRSLGVLAACEAVFTAAARRLLRKGFTVPAADVAAWHRLAEHQIASLTFASQTCHPLTRPDWDGHDNFWADAWIFSLRLPPPDRFDHATLAWHFPGWVAELPPLSKMHWPSSFISPIRASGGVRRMVDLATEVLRGFPTLPTNREFPRVLVPAAVLLAPGRGWTLPASCLQDLPGTWEGHRLAQLLPRRPATERTAIADMLWDNLPFFQGQTDGVPLTQRLVRIDRHARAYLPFIAENISEAALLRTIQRDGIFYHGDDPTLVWQFPRERRRFIVREGMAGVRHQQTGWSTAREFVPLLGDEDMDLLLEIIGDSDKFVAAEFTAFVWRIAPAHALEQAIAAITGQMPTAHAWCVHAPRERLAELAEPLRSGPRPLPEWVASWAESRLLAAGTAAEALFDLTTGAM